MPADHDSAKMPMPKPQMPIAVTGMGVVTSLGLGKEDNWRALSHGVTGIKPIKRFATDGLKTRFAGTVDTEAQFSSSPERTEFLARTAAEEALAQASLRSTSEFPGPLFLAAPPVETEWAQRAEMAQLLEGANDISYDGLIRVSGWFPHYHERFLFGTIADRLSSRFGVQGSPITVTTACASGITAIQLGVEAIRREECDIALCIAADGSVNPESLARFSLLSALSTENEAPERASKPFSKNRDGFVMGEGAAALVLESAHAARNRGAKIQGWIRGVGEAIDSYHRTRSRPDGSRIIHCIRNALTDAGITRDQIDHINAHGTSTPENDKMEAIGLSAVLGERMRSVPVTSNKSMIGHALSAAGAIEAVFSILTLQNQHLPPTINYDVPDPTIELNIVGNKGRDFRMNTVLSNSFGFGGQNASLVISIDPR